MELDGFAHLNRGWAFARGEHLGQSAPTDVALSSDPYSQKANQRSYVTYEVRVSMCTSIEEPSVGESEGETAPRATRRGLDTALHSRQYVYKIPSTLDCAIRQPHASREDTEGVQSTS